ncbi:MAG: hypothetical protein JWO03_3823 [Bacteroidetes bacterium]|nr:hypothetical protein [Bacteroidota bacterium]
MAFSKALYYPTIDITNDSWLKSAVLFWDEISTIVPDSIGNPYQTAVSQYLYDREILQPVRVNPDDRIVRELTTQTVNYLNSNEGFQLLTQGQDLNATLHRDKLPRDLRNLFDIHPEKLPHEIQYILRNSMKGDGWLEVNSSFASSYLTLLANKICEQKSIALLTDRTLTSNFTDKVRLDNQISTRSRRYDYEERGQEKYINLAQGMLTNLIIEGISISDMTSIEDVVKFKKDHPDDLGLFRLNIAKLTEKVKEDRPMEAIRQDIQDVYKDGFLPAYNNLKKSMKGFGIKSFGESFMKVAGFSASATGIPAYALGLSIPYALLVGVGASIVTSAVSYNIDKAEKLRSSPYSYLLAIDKNI